MAIHEVWTEDADEADRHITVRLFDPRPRYFHGGLHREAEMVRRGGEMGDDVLLHVTPDEFDQLRSAWGEPTLNSNTGMPEYGLSRLFKKTGKFVKRALKNPLVSTALMVGANILLPGVGGLIAQSLIGAAGSKAKGGNPWLGALTGAAGHFIGGGNMAVGGGGQGTLSSLAGKIPTTAGASAGAGSAGVEDLAHLAGATGGAGGMKGTLSGLAAKAGDVAKPLAEGALKTAASPMGRISTQLALEGMRGSEASYAQAMKQFGDEQNQQDMTGGGGGGGGFGDSLRQLPFSRQRRSPTDYFRYGRDGGEQMFFDNSQLPAFNVDELEQPTQPGMADGGGVRGPGSGRSDDIEALLSDGEYVFDAESVALLGDGSVDEGARRLDEMRSNIRKHKGQGLAKGDFSEDAHDPEHYIGKPNRRRKSRRERKAEGGGVKAIQRMTTLADQFHQALGSGNQARVTEIARQLDGLHPEASKKSVEAFAKGGSVAEVVKKLLSGRQGGDRRVKPRVEAPERRAIDVYPNERQNLDEIAELLRVLKPESDALRQFESDKTRRGKSVKDIVE